MSDEPTPEEIHSQMNDNCLAVLAKFQSLIVGELEKPKSSHRALESLTSAAQSYADFEMSRNAITGSFAGKE